MFFFSTKNIPFIRALVINGIVNTVETPPTHILRPKLYAYSASGLCTEVVSTLKLACNGAGAEVDCLPRDMPVIVSLLAPGGYHLNVAASSGGWSIDHTDYRPTCVAALDSSVSGMEVMFFMLVHYMG